MQISVNPVRCHPLGYLPLIPVGSLGLAKREPNLYREQRVERAHSSQSGMSNIQLNFTFNRLPRLSHTSSPRPCSKFAVNHLFLISISIHAVNKAKQVVTYVSPTARSESFTLISLIFERRSV